MMHENGRGGRVCFAIEAKLFELSVEGIGRKQKFVIIERSRGMAAWIHQLWKRGFAHLVERR